MQQRDKMIIGTILSTLTLHFGSLHSKRVMNTGIIMIIHSILFDAAKAIFRFIDEVVNIGNFIVNFLTSFLGFIDITL